MRRLLLGCLGVSAVLLAAAPLAAHDSSPPAAVSAAKVVAPAPHVEYTITQPAALAVAVVERAPVSAAHVVRGTDYLRDSKRLDWLKSNANSHAVDVPVRLTIGHRAYVQGEDLRELIDKSAGRLNL
jgi:hypothetical protein